MKKKSQREKYETCLLVLDANILIKDFWWEGAICSYLRSRLFLGHTLVIPDVALKEAVNSIISRSSDLAERIAFSGTTPRLVSQYQRLFRKQNIDGESPEELGARYQVFLYSIIAENGGFVATIPRVSLSAIVDRSLTRKKPFSAGDRGFRDTLIWLSTVHLVKTYSRVSFVSLNTNDFSSDGLDLHPELAEEVSKALPQGIRFRYFKSLDEFVADFDSDGSASAGAFRRAILTTGYKGFNIDKWIRRNLTRLSRDCEHDGICWAGLPYWAEDPRMLKVVRLVGLSIDEPAVAGSALRRRHTS